MRIEVVEALQPPRGTSCGGLTTLVVGVTNLQLLTNVRPPQGVDHEGPMTPCKVYAFVTSHRGATSMMGHDALQSAL